ncbi:MAG TPA: cytochrome c [Mariprofundaceae bacterium]|nr:cytochrome c [Mariprofundaceae bacterium]
MKTWIMLGVVSLALCSGNALAADAPAAPGMGRMMMGNGMPAVADERESAGIPEQMKARHLARMRSHLEAVHDIIEAIAAGEFDKASEVARTGLAMAGMGGGRGMGKGMGMGPGQGMGPGMCGGPNKNAGMCQGMSNEGFKSLGMAFHESAGKLAEVLKTGDEKESLRALGNTVNYCIQCHATYRQ